MTYGAHLVQVRDVARDDLVIRELLRLRVAEPMASLVSLVSLMIRELSSTASRNLPLGGAVAAALDFSLFTPKLPAVHT